MSDHIPFEIQVQIIKSLPIKSLIQFRSVSKAWKSLIDSSDFIADYTLLGPAQKQHLLIRYYELAYVSIVDDDSFPKNRFSLTVPSSVNLLWDAIVVGTSHGLVCLYGYYRNKGDFGYDSRTSMAVLWNPSIRKSVAIVVPDVYCFQDPDFGFGVCPATCDPKIVKIKKKHRKWQVEVYSLSSGVWRSSSGNLSDELFEIKWPHSQVTIDGFIYWFGIRNTIDRQFHLLISFDLSTEEFGEIYLPNELAFHAQKLLFLCKRIDSLVVVQEWENTYEVWMMENGDPKPFTKLFTFNKPHFNSVLLEFRWNGEIMMKIEDDTDDTGDSYSLIVYEPFSEHIKDVGIKDRCYSLLVSSFTESLILLDQSDTLVDDEDDE